jgi:hypothetical protein
MYRLLYYAASNVLLWPCLQRLELSSLIYVSCNDGCSACRRFYVTNTDVTERYAEQSE